MQPSALSGEGNLYSLPELNEILIRPFFIFQHRLVRIMEAQTSTDGILTGSLVNESSESVKANDPLHRRYTLMMQICAATNTKEDISRAMSIAFEVLDRMIRDNMKLNPKTFHLMYLCVQNFLDQNPEEEKQELLQRVFEPASRHGISRADVTGWHKESNRRKNQLGAKTYI